MSKAAASQMHMRLCNCTPNLPCSDANLRRNALPLTAAMVW